MPGGGIDLRITGGDAFDRVAAKLKFAASPGGLKRRLHDALDRAAEPLREDVRQAELDSLPRRGGLAARVANIPIRIVREPRGVQLRQEGVPGAESLVQMDAGRVNHPAYGHGLVKQRIKGGFWTDTLNSSKTKETVRAEMLRAVEDTIREIDR